jgi:hypothetical protein
MKYDLPTGYVVTKLVQNNFLLEIKLLFRHVVNVEKESVGRNLSRYNRMRNIFLLCAMLKIDHGTLDPKLGYMKLFFALQKVCQHNIIYFIKLKLFVILDGCNWSYVYKSSF